MSYIYANAELVDLRKRVSALEQRLETLIHRLNSETKDRLIDADYLHFASGMIKVLSRGEADVQGKFVRMNEAGQYEYGDVRYSIQDLLSSSSIRLGTKEEWDGLVSGIKQSLGEL